MKKKGIELGNLDEEVEEGFSSRSDGHLRYSDKGGKDEFRTTEKFAFGEQADQPPEFHEVGALKLKTSDGLTKILKHAPGKHDKTSHGFGNGGTKEKIRRRGVFLILLTLLPATIARWEEASSVAVLLKQRSAVPRHLRLRWSTFARKLFPRIVKFEIRRESSECKELWVSLMLVLFICLHFEYLTFTKSQGSAPFYLLNLIDVCIYMCTQQPSTMHTHVPGHPDTIPKI